MVMYGLKYLVLLVTVLFPTVLVHAVAGHQPDFAEGGIYYYVVNSDEATVGVTYKFGTTNNWHYSYSGIVTVPEQVEHEGTTYTVTEIGEGAFFACSVTSVVLPDGIESIGEGAFNQCTSLTSLTFPASLRNIGTWAFSNTRLTSVVLPEGLEVIPDDAFRNVSTLTNVVFPSTLKTIGIEAFWGARLSNLLLREGLESIGNNAFRENPFEQVVIPSTVKILMGGAFYGCTNLKDVLFQHPGDLEIIGTYVFYKAPIQTIFIPKEVKEIRDDAFRECKQLETVEFEEGSQLVKIGDRSFMDCTSMAGTFTVPDGVTSIGYAAFSRCSFEKIDLPDGITQIPESMCQYCSNLTQANIPANVASVGASAFGNCSNLTLDLQSATTSVGANAFLAVPTINISYPDSWVSMLAQSATIIGAGEFGYLSPHVYYEGNLLTDIAVPDGVTSICSNFLLRNAYVESITIPASVTSIGTDAFYGCSKLKNVSLGSGVESIGSYAFSNCNALESVNLEVTKLTVIEQSAFSECPSLLSVSMPSTLETIRKQAFYYCTSLQTVVFNASIREIYDNAFRGCDKITSVDIGDLANWCEVGFYGTATGTTIGSNPLSTAGYLLVGGVQPSTLSIPSGVTKISPFAFSGCAGLDRVTLPNTVTSIGDYAFANCIRFGRINIPNAVTTIGSGAFMGCSDLETISINNSRSQLTSIGESAFRGTALPTVTLPATVSSIGGYAYAECPTLTSFTMPPLMTKVPKCMFQECVNLTEVNLHDQVATIEDQAFEACTALRSIHLPASIQKLGYLSFSGIGWNIYIDDLAAWCGISFNSSWTDEFKLYLGDELVEDLVIPEGVKSISDYAFYKNSDIKSVTLTEGLDTIGSMCFYNDRYLTKIYVQALLKKVENGAFGSIGNSAYRPVSIYITDLENYIRSRMSNETTIYFGGGSQSATISLYLNNQLITDLVIPEGIKALGADFRYGVFKTVTLPSTLEEIGFEAFRYCNQMTTVYAKSKYVPTCVGTSTPGIYPKSTALNAIYVPAGRGNNYKAGWTANAAIIQEAPEQIEFDGDVTASDVTEAVRAHSMVYNSLVGFVNLAHATVDDSFTPETLTDITSQGAVVFMPEGSEAVDVPNVVAAGHATQLDLYEGVNFSVPYDFHADQVVYHANFTYGTLRPNTLCLPYDVDAIPAGMVALALTGQDGVGQLVFDEVDAIQAYQPYMLVVTDNECKSITVADVDVKATPVDLPVVMTDDFDFVGTLSELSHDDAVDIDAWAMDGHGKWISLYDAPDDIAVPAHHAYLIPADVTTSISHVLNLTSIPMSLLGDVNNDGEVTAQDASLVQQHVAGKISVSDESVADVNHDGEVTSQDASLIQQKVAGKISW